MAVTAADHHCRVADPYVLAVLARNAIFSLKGFTARAGLLGGIHDRMIFGRDVSNPFFRSRQPFVHGVAEHRFDLRADVEPLASHAEFGDVTYGRDLLDEHAVLDLGLVTSALRAYSIGDVAADADGAAIGQRSNGHFHGHHSSVAVVYGEGSKPLAMF